MSTGHQNAKYAMDQFAYDKKAGRIYIIFAWNDWDVEPPKKLALHQLMLAA
ncbi:Uu.00g037770.m01.CDS01 [Anthostomella pinea]|uniref:Uu.00g037770.m01.CDS01 n=1 Tax=Anthostomella pinea TaxID=933095 RepID=A0AAI8YB96_9PEZI|nr:Uu.00g037770.m01.CDS01 [Anthostomella pinea]